MIILFIFLSFIESPKLTEKLVEELLFIDCYYIDKKTYSITILDNENSEFQKILGSNYGQKGDYSVYVVRQSTESKHENIDMKIKSIIETSPYNYLVEIEGGKCFQKAFIEINTDKRNLLFQTTYLNPSH